MPGSVIPDQEPVGLALLEQTLTTPVQKMGGDGTDRTTCDEAQPHLRTVRLLLWPRLPEYAIASQHFGIRVVLAPGLLHQTNRMGWVLPGMRLRQREPTPPDLIGKSNGPGGLLTAQAIKRSRAFFLAGPAGRGW